MIDYNSIHLAGLSVGNLFISFYWTFFLLGLFIIHRLVTESFRSGNFSIFDHKESKFIDYPKTVNKIVFWSAVGWQVGGRLGYAILHADRAAAFQSQGLSSRSAVLGMLLTTTLVGKQLRLNIPKLVDILAFITPTFLFLMRISQFLSDPVPGKPTTLSYGIIYPAYGNMPRHPFRLYEALTEGLILQLFLILNKKQFTRQGRITCLFLLGYIIAGDVSSLFIDPSLVAEPMVGAFPFRHFVSLLLGCAVIFIVLKWRGKQPQAT